MIDLVLLGTIAVSAIMGMFRGLLAMLIGLGSWVGACWASWQFGGLVAHRLAGGQVPGLGDLAIGHAVVFLLAYVLVMLAGRLLRQTAEAVELSGVDRMAGLLMGAARGVLMALVLVLVGSLSPLAGQPDWNASMAVRHLSPWSERLRQALPNLLEAAMQTPDESDMGKPARSGDNPSLNDNGKGHPWPAPLSRSP